MMHYQHNQIQVCNASALLGFHSPAIDFAMVSLVNALDDAAAAEDKAQT